MVWCGILLWYVTWYGRVWYGMVWYGMVWYGMAWDMIGMVWYGMAWYSNGNGNGTGNSNGTVRYGMVMVCYGNSMVW